MFDSLIPCKKIHPLFLIYSEMVKLSVFVKALFLLILFPALLSAQQDSSDAKWYIGFQGGFLNGSLNSTGSNINVTTSRFSFDETIYPSFGLHTGYSFTEFERLQLSFMTGRFSLLTDHEFWPDLRFTNEFETVTLSTQLSIRRLTTALPPATDLYGNFGIGFRNSNQTVVAINDSVIPDDKQDLTKSRDLSLIFHAGAGLNIRLTQSLLFFLQYDYHFSNQDVVSSRFAGEILNNDFIQTTNQWGTLGAGFRLRFGSPRSRRAPAPDFAMPEVIAVEAERTIEEQDVLDAEITEAVEESITVDHQDDTAAERRDDGTPPESTEIVEEIAERIEAIITEQKVETADEASAVEEEAVAEQEITGTEETTPLTEIRSEPSAEEATPYGLYGTLEGSFVGYSFSVYSFSTSSRAEGVRQKLVEAGFRSRVVHAVVNGVDYYRVVIGLFPSRQQARNEIDNLPEQYRTYHFLVSVNEP